MIGRAMIRGTTAAAMMLALLLTAGGTLAQAPAGAGSGRIAATHEPTGGHQEPPGGGQEPADHAPQEHPVDEHAADEHEAEAHGPTWGELGARWINFVLLVGVLYWLLVDPPAFVRENFEFGGLRELLAARGAGIVQARELAQEQTRDATSRLAESSRRVENVEAEAAALVAQAREDGARERARSETDAVAEASRIRDSADRDLNAEIGRAGRALQAHVANLAVGIATRIVKDNFTGEDQERLVREYLDRLGETVR